MNSNQGDRQDNDLAALPGSRNKTTSNSGFSSEELRVIKECNRESFYQRCVPLGSAFGIATYYAVQSGYLKPSPRFGATPKVFVSVIIGYFVGKFSYQNKCSEKFMKLPNSRIGEMLRQRRRGGSQESLDTGFGPGMTLAPFSGMSSSDTYTDLGPKSSLDIDTNRPHLEGLDDSHRPSLDNPNIYEDEMPPIQKHTTTYEELRRQNRDEYQQTGNYRAPVATTPPTGSNSPLAVPQPQEHAMPRGRTNKYGDSWG